jgi:hypothetical protein
MTKKHRLSGIDSTFYSGTAIRPDDIDPDNFEQLRDGILKSPNGQTIGNISYDGDPQTPLHTLDGIEPAVNDDVIAVVGYTAMDYPELP